MHVIIRMQMQCFGSMERFSQIDWKKEPTRLDISPGKDVIPVPSCEWDDLRSQARFMVSPDISPVDKCGRGW